LSNNKLKLAYADNIGQVHANRMHRIHKSSLWVT